jgi:hypothetical protein
MDIFTFKVSSIIIIYTEFSLYFWLNITFFEVFYTLKWVLRKYLSSIFKEKKHFLCRSCSNGRISGGNPKRLKYYYLVAYLLPIIIPIGFAIFCFLFKNFDFLLNIWIIVAKQRSVPGFHFARRTEDFTKTFGLFEIMIKSITLGFFFGSIFYIWKSDQELTKLNVQVHRSRTSNWNKYWLTSNQKNE